MKILVISDVNINDLVSLNIVQNELIASNEQEVIDFDLVFIRKLKGKNIFFNESKFKNIFNLSFLNYFTNDSAAIKNTQYEHVINLSPGFFSQFILKRMKSKEKVSAPFILKKYFFNERFFNRKTIDTLCGRVLNSFSKITSKGGQNPTVQIDSEKYQRVFEITNWLLKSSNNQPLGNNSFCFFYLKKTENSAIIKEEFLFNYLKSLIASNILTLIVLEEHHKSSFQDLIVDHFENEPKIIPNFVANNDSDYLYLFIKNARFVITNDETVDIASKQMGKKSLFYDFKSKTSFENHNPSFDLENIIRS